MPKLEVFFDYTCPFCLRAHEYLKELISLHPEIEIVWRPCEAHPRPECYGRHSDLCIQGMFFAMDNSADIWAYHDRMFSVAKDRRTDIEDINSLVDSVRDIVDADALRASLKSGKYKKAVEDSNSYAYDKSGVWAVPSYRMNGMKLDSVEGIGVSKRQLADFMNKAKV
jgi:predicted DsbA family dithiol-disulfide isomerase